MKVKTSRISFDEYIIRICHAVAARSTCRHREQGAVIIKGKRIISTGYNGAPPGVEDCLERGFCSKEANLPCLAEALHGESNALVTAAREGISVDGAIVYCIFSPCRGCANMMKTAGIREVVFEELYDGFPEGPSYLKTLGLKVRMLYTETGMSIAELTAIAEAPHSSGWEQEWAKQELDKRKKGVAND